MSTIDINTNNIRQTGNDIISLTNEIRAILDDTFTMISNMSLETGEWQGTSAEEFVSLANVDKGNYNRLIQEINNFGKYLVNYSDEMESLIARVDRI